MLDLNPTTLAAVVEKACHDAANHPRWLQAIARAIVELESNPFIGRNPNGHGVIIGSTSGNAYAANGTCSCRAFEFGQPCYHRAIARLVRLHDERQAKIRLEGAAIAEAVGAGVITMPEGDTLDTDGMRVARKIAAARATALLNECFA